MIRALGVVSEMAQASSLCQARFVLEWSVG